MNTASLIGRFTKDPQINVTPNNKKVVNFTLAVNRDRDNTDFIQCVAWEKKAEVIGQYFHKGSLIGVVGKIQTRSRKDSEDRTIYITEVWVDDITFIDKKTDNDEQKNELPTLDVSADNLPF